jgi:hypothetical protein
MRSGVYIRESDSVPIGRLSIVTLLSVSGF